MVETRKQKQARLAHLGLDALDSQMAGMQITQSDGTNQNGSRDAGQGVTVSTEDVARAYQPAQTACSESMEEPSETIANTNQSPVRYSRRHRRCRKQQQQKVNDVQREEFEETTKQMAEHSVKQSTPTTPALLILAGIDYQRQTKNVLIDRILKSIESALTKSPGVVLRGRTKDQLRIDYQPTSRNITSIRSRMDKVLDGGIDLKVLESLLRPLVLTNQAAFHAADGADLGQLRLEERAYRSCWIFNQKLHNKIRPISLSKQDTVVAEVVKAMRERCQKVDPESPLLRSYEHLERSGDKATRNRVGKWGLHGLQSGLASKIRVCFDGPECSSEEYEDRIEALLYTYRMINKTEIYGAENTL